MALLKTFSCLIFSALAINLVDSFNLEDPASKSNSTTPATNLNSTEVSNSTENALDDRFNFNVNRAGAYGVGRYGGLSHSDAISYGVNAGIRKANGQYQSLYSDSGAKSNSYSSGPGAPLTFATTGTRFRPGYGGGHASSGLYGGMGNAYAQSQNQRIEIPLDNRGTVFLSNLKERDNSTSSSVSPTSEATVTSTSSQKKETDSLVFAS